MKNASRTILVLLLLFAAPLSAADRETRQMMADLRILQVQAQELQNLIAAMNQAMTDALKGVNARLNDQADTSRKAFADQKLTIDALVNDLRVVREKVDDNNVRVGSLAQEVEALRETVQQLNVPPPPVAAMPIDAPAGAEPVDTPPDPLPAPAPPALPVPSGAAAVGMSPQRLWDGAWADYASGQYDLAILGFESYVKSFPRSVRTAEAQVYIGHAYYQDGNYAKAVEAYDMAIRTYPTSDVLPDAYVRKGESLKNLKDPDRAREAFEYVIKTYPDSVAAISAKQKLQGLQP